MQTTYWTENGVFKLYGVEKFTRFIGLNLEVKQRYPRAAYKLGPGKGYEKNKVGLYSFEGRWLKSENSFSPRFKLELYTSCIFVHLKLKLR